MLAGLQILGEGPGFEGISLEDIEKVLTYLEVPDLGIVLALNADVDGDGLLSIDEILVFMNDPVFAAALGYFLENY